MNALAENLLAFSRRYPLVVSSVVVLILTGGAYYYLDSQQAEFERRHDEVKRKGESMLQAISEHPRLSSQLAAARRAVTIIDRDLVDESDLATNLGYFYDLESSTGVRIGQLSQLSSQPIDGAMFKSVPFTVDATGTYAQIMRFLRDLETGPRLVRITRYQLDRGDGTAAVRLDLSIEMLAKP